MQTEKNPINAIMERVHCNLKHRADTQAGHDAAAFTRHLTLLLTKHGIDASYARWRMAPAFSEEYRKRRAQDLLNAMEDEVAKSILDAVGPLPELEEDKSGKEEAA